jgi:organic hydroperoxide reductase OsmC/OhrA
MFISSTIRNSLSQNEISVATEGNEKEITIPNKTEGRGSSVNGGELLFLSLATCFCNDIYREAASRKMYIVSVEVTVSGNFGKEGEAGYDIVCNANIDAPNHSKQEISDLIEHVDKIAEIHNTLRKGTPVSLKII